MKNPRTQSYLKQIETMIWEAMVRNQHLPTDEILLMVSQHLGRDLSARWKKQFVKEIEKIRIRLRKRKQHYKSRSVQLSDEFGVQPEWVYRWLMKDLIQIKKPSQLKRLLEITRERDAALAFEEKKVPKDATVPLESFIEELAMPDLNLE